MLLRFLLLCVCYCSCCFILFLCVVCVFVLCCLFVLFLFCFVCFLFVFFGFVLVFCGFFFFFLGGGCSSYHVTTSRSQHRTTQKDNTLPGLGVVVAGMVVVVRGRVVNAGVVVEAVMQVSNDGDSKRCCRIGNRQKRMK